MANPSRSHFSLQAIGIEGALITLAPTGFLVAGTFSAKTTLSLWRFGAATAAALLCLFTAFFLLQRPNLARWSGFLALLAAGLTAAPRMLLDPVAALLWAVAMLSFAFLLIEYRFLPDPAIRTTVVKRNRQRARWSTLSILGLLFGSLFTDTADQAVTQAVLGCAILTSHALLCRWIWHQYQGHARTTLLILDCALLMAAGLSMQAGTPRLATLVALAPNLFLLAGKSAALEQREQWWEPLLNHPSRILFTTFFGLCCLGTMLLLLPRATQTMGIAPIDAAFTAVSAVCVTGLTVLDTPTAFSPLGQFFLVILIQAGGLGIMTLTTVGMHALGKRLSLRQERLLTSLTETSHQDLVTSLWTIVRFTFLVEGAGALLLSSFFFAAGDHLAQALWRGLFTSISAFCNAGFALQSNNLIAYQGNPLILHTIAALIIFGGLAPAVSLLFPRWLTRQTVPLSARIAFTVTLVLLLTGTGFFLLLEWNGALAGLSPADKVHNAWFQAVTPRTAGFNSIDITGLSNPIVAIMVCLMFIGGSPGGTAGGIKTTTLGVLMMTFWASIIGRAEIIAQNRRISQETINRAVTITASGFIILSLVIFMLQMTQQIPARELIFEAASALGTVGLTIGATPKLDDMGKIIVMCAMFVGRIGPMTLFMLLSQERQGPQPRCPESRISLT